VSTRYGKIYYRGYHIDDTGNKKRVHGKLAHKPTLYLNADKPTAYKSLYGKHLQSKEFDSIPVAREFIKSHKDVMDIYGYDSNKFEYEFLAKSFPEILEVLISDVCVGSIDIETTTEHGKIDTINVPEEILLITYQNIRTKKIQTFGSRTSKSDNYTLCVDESDVLRKFIRCIQEEDPDIITGWNSNSFDIPYIVNKSIKLLGEEETNKLSPFGNIDIRDKEYQGKLEQDITIVGRSCLDMLELYKKFTYTKRENYRLDTIARVELGEGKLENKYSSFREWYESDFTEFTNYNQIDVVRVSQLEDKLGLISLVMSVAYLTKCNYDDVFSPVKYWECYILSELHKENTFVSIKRKHSSAEQLDGAYVMEPKIGFHDWVVSIDGAALYPSIIRGLNMSPDTIIDKDSEISIDSFLSGKHNFKSESFTVAANGVRFNNSFEGVMPRLVSNVLDGRSIAKKKMLTAKQDYELISEELIRRGIHKNL
jgi:DNA polymerase elongation subunit (family B)